MDSIEIEFACKHTPFGQKVQKVNEDGSVQNTLYRNRCRIDNRNKTGRVYAYSADDGNRIRVEGSIANFFLGHNIYGVADIHSAMRRLAERVTDSLGIKPSIQEKRSWQDGDIKIIRIDIVASILCKNESEKHEVLKTIFKHINETQKNVSRYGYETIYINQHSRSTTIKFYDKQAEIMAKPKVANLLLKTLNRLPNHVECTDHIRRLIRVEICYRSPFLKLKNLEYVKYWDKNQLFTLFSNSFSEVKLSGDFTVPTVDLLSSVKDVTYRQTLYAYLNGAPLKEIITNRKTYYNHVKYFKENHNIDLEQSINIISEIKKIEDIFSPCNIIYTRPDIFIPKKNNYLDILLTADFVTMLNINNSLNFPVLLSGKKAFALLISFGTSLSNDPAILSMYLLSNRKEQSAHSFAISALE